MKRAAWLDHPVRFISDASMFEIERLGLGNSDTILLEGQVDIMIDPATGESIISVKDVEIVSVDEMNNSANYRIRGETRFMQQWDLGGANLAVDGSGWMLM